MFPWCFGRLVSGGVFTTASPYRLGVDRSAVLNEDHLSVEGLLAQHLKKVRSDSLAGVLQLLNTTSPQSCHCITSRKGNWFEPH